MSSELLTQPTVETYTKTGGNRSGIHKLRDHPVDILLYMYLLLHIIIYILYSAAASADAGPIGHLLLTGLKLMTCFTPDTWMAGH